MSEYEDSIAKLEVKISSAKANQITAEKVNQVFKPGIQELEFASDEDRRVFMNCLLDSVQIHEKK